MKETFARMVYGMSDPELEALSRAVYAEKNNRIKQKIENNQYPELNFEEKVSAKSDNKIGAIKAYRERTDMYLHEAKLIVEAFINQNIGF